MTNLITGWIPIKLILGQTNSRDRVERERAMESLGCLSSRTPRPLSVRMARTTPPILITKPE